MSKFVQENDVFWRSLITLFHLWKMTTENYWLLVDAYGERSDDADDPKKPMNNGLNALECCKRLGASRVAKNFRRCKFANIIG